MPKIIAQKEDWIKLGYTLFSDQGIAGIVIEKMAKKLACNKSSFYWHFQTKKAFITELVQYWITNETEKIIGKTQTTLSPSEKFELFLELTFKYDPHTGFIFFLKRYAIRHPEIQQIIDDIDDKRISYTSTLLQEIGYSKAEANPKARVFYNYLIGYHEMLKNKTQAENYLDIVKQDLQHFIKI